MALLYVETNLLIAVATGRAPLARTLLEKRPRHLQLAVPGICFFEALNWMESEIKRREDLGRMLGQQVHELGRDVSGATQGIRFHLEEATLQNGQLLKFINDRLFWAIEKLSSEAYILPLTTANLEASRRDCFIPELTDNLILHTILDHARYSSEVDKAMLTENRKDFDRTEARDAMITANLKSFFDYQQLMGWIGSRLGADPYEHTV